MITITRLYWNANYQNELAPVIKSQYDAFFLTLKNLNYSSGYKKDLFNDRLNDVLNDGLNESEQELLTIEMYHIESYS